MPVPPSSVTAPLWEQFHALLPRRRVVHPLGCHRPRVPDRVVFGKLLARLVPGGTYQQHADHQVSATTLRSRRDERIAAGVFEALHQAAPPADGTGVVPGDDQGVGGDDGEVGDGDVPAARVSVGLVPHADLAQVVGVHAHARLVGHLSGRRRAARLPLVHVAAGQCPRALVRPMAMRRGSAGRSA